MKNQLKLSKYYDTPLSQEAQLLSQQGNTTIHRVQSYQGYMSMYATKEI